MARVLITGASGFVGRALLRSLAGGAMTLRGAYRDVASAPSSVEAVRIGELGARTDWSGALADIDAVVHLASPAHARFEERDLRAAIVEGTHALVKQAAAAGAKRFIYMSSIKAAAARTNGMAISEPVLPKPADAYGRAKLAAEAIVLAQSGLNPVVLRPPLVHGPEAKANFALLLRLAASPLPLPFNGVRNQRSLLALSSLVEALRAVLRQPEGPSGVFHLADQPALSSAEMIAALRRGIGRSANLFRSPLLAALAPGPLRESLALDDRAFRAAYQYAPTQDARELLEETARSWRQRP